MFDFDTMVDRTGTGNLKHSLTPAPLLEHEIPCFAAAEMDFKTAPSVIESVKRMADKGAFGFTLADEPYQTAVQWWMREMRSWEIQPDWIVPVLGTIFSIATAIRMTTKPGEGVIIQTPVYYRYEQAVHRLERQIVYNPLKNHNGVYEMDLADLEEKMRQPQNHLLVLCNAQNPIARVWRENELREVGKLSAKYGVVVICDEIFGEMTYGGHTVVPYASLPEGGEWAISVTSLGKAFNFTGVNHANVLIPNKTLRERYEKQKYSDHYGSVGPMEYASILGAYSPDGKEWFMAARAYMEKNAALITGFLKKNIPLVQLSPIEGTCVCWVDWSFLGLEGEKLEEFFLKEALFQAECGAVYSTDCAAMMRINFSCPEKLLREALERVAKAVKKKERVYV